MVVTKLILQNTIRRREGVHKNPYHSTPSNSHVLMLIIQSLKSWKTSEFTTIYIVLFPRLKILAIATSLTLSSLRVAGFDPVRLMFARRIIGFISVQDELRFCKARFR